MCCQSFKHLNAAGIFALKTLSPLPCFQHRDKPLHARRDYCPQHFEVFGWLMLLVKKCRLVMNFRLSCTWCSADSTAPGPRCAEHRHHHQPQTAATKFLAPTGLWDQLLPSLLASYSFCCMSQRPDRKQNQGSNSGHCCTSTKIFALFFKMQFLKEKNTQFSLSCWSVAWAVPGSRKGDAGGSVCARLEPPSQLPVSPSRWC